MTTAGHPPRHPTAQQTHDARQYARTGASDEEICEAVGIPEATYRHNKGKKIWDEYRASIRKGRAEGVVLVKAENYRAATSDKDPTRAEARRLHLKYVGGWKDTLEVTGKDGSELIPDTVRVVTVGELLKKIGKAQGIEIPK